MQNTEPLLLTVREVAGLLNVSERHVHNLRKRRELPPPVVLGRSVRWHRKAIEHWLSGGRESMALAPEGTTR